MENTNSFRLFKENRLVMKGPEKAKSASDEARNELDAMLFGEPAKDPVESAKDKAKGLIDKKQEVAFEQARKSTVKEATKKIYSIVNRLEKDRVALDRLADKNTDSVSQRVALEYIFRALDKTGARGKGGYKIRRPKMYVSGTMSAILSQAVENLFSNEFRINDVTDAGEFNSVEDYLDRVSKRGKGAKGRNEVWSRYNKFAALTNAVQIAKMELA